MDRFANREAVRLAFEEVPVLDAVRVRRQDGAVRTGIGLYTLNRITTTAARHVNWQRHALRRGRCDGTLAACRWKTSLAVLPRQRRWTPWFPRILAMAGAALDVAAAIRPPSLQGMAVAIPGISLRWSTWARREEQGRLRPGGAESRRRERNPLEYRTAADRMDDGCSPESVRRLDMDPHRAFKTCSPGSEIATGGVPIRECGNSLPRGLQEVGDGRSEEGRGATGYAYAATSRGSAGRWSTARS